LILYLSLNSNLKDTITERDTKVEEKERKVIEESNGACGTRTSYIPWYAFVSPWRLITYIYPLLQDT
jgi:hypothetical protein